MYKRIINIIIVLTMFIGAINVQAEVMELTYDGENYLYDLPPITLFINEQRIETKTMPPIQLEAEAATLVPIREVFEPIGAFVEWKETEKKVYIDYQDTLLILEIDGEEAWINGEWQSMDMPAKIINGKIMVPLRFISEQIGFEVKWIQETREIYISDKEKNIIPEDLEDKESVDEIIDLSELMMSYERTEQELVVYMPSVFEMKDITIREDHVDKTIKVNLNEDYSYYFGEGRVSLQDDNVKAIAVDTDETTQITLELARWYEIEMIEKKEGLHIRLIRPKEKYDKIIMLDAGHGGNAPGSIGNQLVEKDINLKQTLAVKNFIEANTDIKVYLTRNEDISLSVEDRPEIANAIEADIFISIHNNSAVTLEANGTEVLYYPDEWDTRSEEMASILQEKLILYTGLRDRGIKPGSDLWVLKMSKMPAVLIEGAFLSNENDASYLANEDFTMQYAYAVYEAVVEIFNTMSFR